MSVSTPPAPAKLTPPITTPLSPHPLWGPLQRVFRPIYRPIWRAVTQWIDADGLRMSAAMSFYGILSLAPLLVLLVAVLG